MRPDREGCVLRERFLSGSHCQRLVYPGRSYRTGRIVKNDKEQLANVYDLQVEVRCLAGKGMVEIQKNGFVFDG